MFTEEELDVEIVINWFSSLKELLLVKTSDGYKKETIKNYKTGIQSFADYCIEEGVHTPSKVTRSIVRAYKNIRLPIATTD